VVLASAAQRHGNRVITVEKGGAYFGHPEHPSADIIEDLRGNISRFGVEDSVTIVAGHNNEPHTIDSVRAALKKQLVGFLFVDSDGRLDRDFPLYREFLAEGAFVIFDDFESEGAGEKSALVRPFVEAGVREGMFRDLGVYKWGTWVGQYRSRRVLQFLRLSRARLFEKLASDRKLKNLPDRVDARQCGA
jgi:hypothetical protein